MPVGVCVARAFQPDVFFLALTGPRKRPVGVESPSYEKRAAGTMRSPLAEMLKSPEFPSPATSEARAAAVNGGKPLRVCHLGKFYPPASGGIETHLQTMARAQADLGLKVQVLCVNHADEQRRDVTWSALTKTATLQENDGAVRLVRIGRWASCARMD